MLCTVATSETQHDAAGVVPATNASKICATPVVCMLQEQARMQHGGVRCLGAVGPTQHAERQL